MVVKPITAHLLFSWVLCQRKLIGPLTVDLSTAVSFLRVAWDPLSLALAFAIFIYPWLFVTLKCYLIMPS